MKRSLYIPPSSLFHPFAPRPLVSSSPSLLSSVLVDEHQTIASLLFPAQHSFDKINLPTHSSLYIPPSSLFHPFAPRPLVSSSPSLLSSVLVDEHQTIASLLFPAQHSFDKINLPTHSSLYIPPSSLFHPFAPRPLVSSSPSLLSSVLVDEHQTIASLLFPAQHSFDKINLPTHSSLYIPPSSLFHPFAPRPLVSSSPSLLSSVLVDEHQTIASLLFPAQHSFDKINLPTHSSLYIPPSSLFHPFAPRPLVSSSPSLLSSVLVDEHQTIASLLFPAQHSFDKINLPTHSSLYIPPSSLFHPFAPRPLVSSSPSLLSSVLVDEHQTIASLLFPAQHSFDKPIYTPSSLFHPFAPRPLVSSSPSLLSSVLVDEHQTIASLLFPAQHSFDKPFIVQPFIVHGITVFLCSRPFIVHEIHRIGLEGGDPKGGEHTFRREERSWQQPAHARDGGRLDGRGGGRGYIG
uniref:Uncharacterized protein n=1 Tax=Pristionchus pacificus TaxID=54126 RepID=A0A2A6CH49_PRIPA|eukprot:PDM77417.1 hypothetical protein PRIPAC_33147 [Pristionchus pacificus]